MKGRTQTGHSPELVAFDMDGTLLAGRVVYALAREFGFMKELEEISRAGDLRYVRSKRVAWLLKGMTVPEFTKVVQKIPLTDGAYEAADSLRKDARVFGIISDSYTLATGMIAGRLKADFHFANTLVVKDGIITGQLRMPMGWEHIDCRCYQSVCKRYHLLKTAERYGVKLQDTAAVGDTESDSCMIESAGTGIWFNPAPGLNLEGRSAVLGTDFRSVSALLK